MQKPRLRERTEQQFFEDPAIDRLLGVAFALSAEVYVLRDRIARLEEALTSKGALTMAELGSTRTPELAKAAAEDRAAFVAALMEPIIASQRSNGAA